MPKKTENLKEAMGEVKEHVREDVEKKVDELQKKGEELIAEGKKLLEEAGKQAGEFKEEVEEKWLANCKKYILTNPFKAVFIAFGIGYIWAKIFRR